MELTVRLFLETRCIMYVLCVCAYVCNAVACDGDDDGYE